jgi:hypothetical protein
VLKRLPFCEAYPGSVAARYLSKLVTALQRFVAGGPRQPQASGS